MNHVGLTVAGRASVLTGFVIAILAATMMGCLFPSETPINLPPTATITMQYYPRLVKGYQNSYPLRRLLVLVPIDAREFNGPEEHDHQPQGVNPAVGVVLNQSLDVMERLYATPLESMAQNAIEQAAKEAGLRPFEGKLNRYDPQFQMGVDYVLATRITRCWVRKRRGPDGRYGPTWFTDAQFAVEVILYKPPFTTPFWQGESASNFSDPPHSNMPGDEEAGIYDQPGQVMSVAFTRAVAGIFKREELRQLVIEDRIVQKR